jgi:hypothetical protein
MNTLAAPGLEELLSAVLERFLQPIHALCVLCKIRLVILTRKQQVNFNKFSCWTQIFFLHIGIGIWRGWRTHRKLHVDTLILIPTFKFYVFSYSRQKDKLTDREINLEEPIRLPSPHRINVSASACVRYGCFCVLILWFMWQFHNAKVMSHQSQYYFCVTDKNSDIDRSSCLSTGKKVPPAHTQRVYPVWAG